MPYKVLKKMHFVPPKSKNHVFWIFIHRAMNNNFFWGLAITYKFKIIYCFGDLAKKMGQNIKNYIFRTFCQNESKMAKKYQKITTVFRVRKYMIFSIFIFFPVFLIYEISRKNPTLAFFAFFDIREIVVILCTQNGNFRDFTHILPKIWVL